MLENILLGEENHTDATFSRFHSQRYRIMENYVYHTLNLDDSRQIIKIKSQHI